MASTKQMEIRKPVSCANRNALRLYLKIQMLALEIRFDRENSMATQNISNDEAYRVALAKVVVAIAPGCLDSWENPGESFDKDIFAKETVDLAEAIMAEISNRNAPETPDSRIKLVEPLNMEDLIKALQIFLKYGNPRYPTHCEHDVLTVCVDPSTVSDEDKDELNRLGFHPVTKGDRCFQSFRFGSA